MTQHPISPWARVVAAVVVAFAILLFALATPAHASTVSSVRFGDHPAYVRVVLDFTHGGIDANQVMATDPAPADGRSVLTVGGSGLSTQVRAAGGLGVTVTVTVAARSRGLRIELRSARLRFKYLSYAVVGGTRLAIDLWKSAPPSRAAEIRTGTRGCLSLRSVKLVPYLVTVSGTERNLFEHQFSVVLRGANGAVLASRHVAATGRWTVQLRYRSARRQAGTIEAVDASPKDGSLACLAQLRVAIPAAPAPTVRVLARYPAPCLKRVTQPSGTGLVAAVQPTGRVTIASPAGGAQTVLAGSVAQGSYPPVNAPGMTNVPPRVQWSPDGRYLALDTGTLWHADGTAAGRLFSRLAWLWSWSPAADCAIGFTTLGDLSHPSTLSLGVPGRAPVPFVRGMLSQFAFSPDGRTLVLVVADRARHQHFLALNLATGRLRELAAAPDGAPSVILGGWGPRNVLLFWSGPGASILADGTRLRGLDLAHGGRLLTYSTLPVIPSPQALARCGTTEYAVVGAGRPYPTIEHKQLAIVAPGTVTRPITPASVGYLAPACSVDNVDIAAVQYASGAPATGSARLAILKANGTFLFHPSASTAFTDTAPEWPEPGILYGRTPLGTATAQLWFAPHGGGAHDTGLRAVAWDWTATPPSGVA